MTAIPEALKPITFDAPPKVREALEEVARCASSNFTGSLTFDFKEGIPLSRKITDSKRL